MEKLPDELLLIIFSKLSFIDILSGVKQTCWHWYRLSRDATLWTSIDFSLIKCFKNSEIINSGIKSMLLDMQDSLESLTFSNLTVDGGIYALFGTTWKQRNEMTFKKLKSLDYSYSDVTYENLRRALTNHSDIEKLVLVHTKITLNQVLEELLHLPNLKYFIFHDSSDNISNRLMNNLNLHYVPKFCQLLEVVELHTLAADLNYYIMSRFLKYCTNLKKLSLTWSTNAVPFQSDIIVYNLASLELHDRQETEPYLEFVLPHFPNLVHLTVSGKNIHLNDSKAIGKHCPKLQELVLEIRCDDMPESHSTCFFNSLCGLQLQIIAERCTQLKKLHASCSNIDDDSVIFLAAHCKHLEDINFSQCHRLTKNALFALSKHCLLLKKVNLQDTFISHRYLIGLVTKCSSLEEVIFDHKTLERSSSPTSASGVNAQVESNECLQEDACLSDDIPFIDMTESADEFELQHTLLNILSTTAETSFSDSNFDTRVAFNDTNVYTPVNINHCHLKKLSLRHSLANEIYLQEIIRECSDLTYVCLDGSQHLTDNLIITLVKSCPNLRHLSISSTPSHMVQSQDIFGDSAILAVVQYACSLEVLQCLYNSRITSVGLTALFQSLSSSLRSLGSISLCVGSGCACCVSAVALHGLRYLTESSKQHLKDAASTARGKSFIVLHLDLLKRR